MESFEAEQVYFINKPVTRERHDAFVQDSFHRNPGDNLPLHTLVARIENGLDSRTEPGAEVEHHLRMAATGTELETLDLAIRDYLSTDGIEYARSLQEAATPVETAYHLKLFVPLEIQTHLEEDSDSISTRLQESLSLDTVGGVSEPLDTKFELHTYLTPDEYAAIESRADESGSKLAQYSKAFIEAIEPFSAEGERGDYAQFIDEDGVSAL